MEIDTKEVLRYLGYHGKPADGETLERIARCGNELMRNVVPRSVSRMCPVTLEADSVRIGELRIESRNLRRHLAGCREAALFAATLGPQADGLMRRYSKTDMSCAVILQACAAALIESYCDDCGKELAEQVKPRGLFLRPRYSPGYGDFSIGYQTDLIRILDCRRAIGLTVTDSLMLAPTKSVTAVIGLTGRKQSCHIARCMECTAENCPFRKDG